MKDTNDEEPVFGIRGKKNTTFESKKFVLESSNQLYPDVIVLVSGVDVGAFVGVVVVLIVCCSLNKNAAASLSLTNICVGGFVFRISKMNTG